MYVDFAKIEKLASLLILNLCQDTTALIPPHCPAQIIQSEVYESSRRLYPSTWFGWEEILMMEANFLADSEILINNLNIEIVKESLARPQLSSDTPEFPGLSCKSFKFFQQDLLKFFSVWSFKDSVDMGKGDGKGKAAAEFDEATLEVYKECFRLMDIDKDGVINKNDLRAAFDNVGRLVKDEELNAMLSEVGGPCNYDNMIKMFAAKMAGGVNDPDDLVVGAFKAFDEEGANIDT